MSSFYYFVKFNEIFLLKIICFWLTIWTSFIIVHHFLFLFFFFDLFYQTLEVLFLFFAETWFFCYLFLKDIIQRYVFTKFISSAALSIA